MKSLLLAALFCVPVFAEDRAGLRAYLDERDPYNPGLTTARLATPQWIGEDGVEAVVRLSIDDMGRREPAFRRTSYAKSPQFYYQFLQPSVETTTGPVCERDAAFSKQNATAAVEGLLSPHFAMLKTMKALRNESSKLGL